MFLDCQVFAFIMATVIITGASSGIGEATALELKKQGYQVVGTYNHSLDRAEFLVKNFGVDMVKCDVSSESQVEELFSYAEKKYGKVSAVISNAGVAIMQKPIIDVSVSEIDSAISVNLKGTLLVNKRAVLSMLSGGGKIINVSSVFGLEGGSCEVVYSATKSGVLGLTRALSEELSNSEISVCAVALGLIDTPMNSHLSNEDKLSFVKEYGLNKVPSSEQVAKEILKILKLDDINGKVFKIFC